MNLFERKGMPPEVSERIRGWVRTHLQLTPEDRVLVHEIRCDDPNCPPHGTVVAVIPASGQPSKYQIALPAAVIRPRDIQKSLSNKD